MTAATKSRFDHLISGEFRTGLTYDFWPSEEVGSKKLLIVLHGRGDSVEGYQWLPESLAIPSFNYLFLNAPDPYGTGYSWYGVPPGQAPGIKRSRRLLFGLIDQLLTAANLAATDIFLFGFSQGCLMCLDVGLRYPKPLGGIVGVSGYVYFLEEYPAAFSRAVPLQKFLVTHGIQDDVLPIEPTRESIEKLRAMGANVDWREYVKAHAIEETSEIPTIQAFLTKLLEAC